MNISIDFFERLRPLLSPDALVKGMVVILEKNRPYLGLPI